MAKASPRFHIALRRVPEFVPTLQVRPGPRSRAQLGDALPDNLVMRSTGAAVVVQAPPVSRDTTTAYRERVAAALRPVPAAASSQEPPQPPGNTGPTPPDASGISTSSLRLSTPSGTPLPSAPGPSSAAPKASASADSEAVAVNKVVGTQALDKRSTKCLRSDFEKFNASAS